MLTEQQLRLFRETGHVTVPAVFDKDEVAAAIADIETWSSEFLAQMSDEQRNWFLEKEHGRECKVAET